MVVVVVGGGVGGVGVAAAADVVGVVVGGLGVAIVSGLVD